MATAGTVAEAKRGDALTRERWKKFFDSDGRLVNEFNMRKAIFEGYLFYDWTRLQKSAKWTHISRDCIYLVLYGALIFLSFLIKFFIDGEIFIMMVSID